MESNLLVPGRRALLTAVCVGMFCLGCGGGPKTKVPDQAQQAKISGKITLDGAKPVPLDTQVLFACAAKGANVNGKTDALGSYTLTVVDKSVGIPAGRYKVTVRPPEPAAAAVGTDDYKKKMMEGMGGMKPPEIKTDIPAKFHSLDKTTIELEIKPGQNTIDLDLSKL